MVQSLGGWKDFFSILYARNLEGLRAYISGKSRVPMLQVLCNPSGEADSLNGNARVISEFFIYVCLNNSIMVKCGLEERTI